MWRSGNKPIQANITTLKVHLGRYLKLVRKGMEVIVLDRQIPVARIVPSLSDTRLVLRQAKLSWEKVLHMLESNDRKVKPRCLGKSSLDYLTIDREGK